MRQSGQGDKVTVAWKTFCSKQALKPPPLVQSGWVGVIIVGPPVWLTGADSERPQEADVIFNEGFSVVNEEPQSL